MKTCPSFKSSFAAQTIMQHLIHNRHTAADVIPLTTSLYTWNKALRQPTGCQKGTAYHLKYHAVHVTLGLYDLYSLKFTKLTVQKQSRRPVIFWFWTVSVIRWAWRYAITKSLCMHKLASRAQAPGFGNKTKQKQKKQAYTVKIHAK